MKIFHMLCARGATIRRRWLRALVALVMGLGLTVATTGCGIGNSQNTIVIGGKNFTEQDIMVDIMQLLIEHDTNLHVKTFTWLDSNVIWNAFENHKLDLYVEYTGTGLVNILKQKPVTDPNQAYDIVHREFEQKYHATWLKPIGFNNTYAMAMTKQEADKLGIHTISQLAAKSGDLTLGTEQDFVVRPDTLPAMNKLYHTHFKRVVTMDIGLKYQALVQGKVDVIDAFSTDGKIPEYHLELLKDDKHLFPPYYACPVIRDDTLKEHPELKPVLNKLAGKISDREMRQLNMEVNVEHKPAMEVARDWLTQQGLI
ncbi:glycine betaine ABC transporter substrate-binding protein [Alicyclobacillus herbarius]|uniref:glycine betaine ABC transporter substrate-binding protein n=1 Tax=Alicyclobacillus herbarius TaxID=122960 RepID=UPI0003F8AD2B|nr:glycine betaine ABC transporter substrate-binding protein [Alicyclobacillus herbarius]